MKKSAKEIDAEVAEAALLKGAVKPDAEKHEVFSFETFELKTIADFEVYNAQVRKHNRFCLHERNKMKIKVPDESFHKKMKVKFVRMEQQENVLKVRLRNKDIDWKGQLKSGGTYQLPYPVVKFLNNLAVPVFTEVKVEHGNAVHTETQQTGEKCRFACQVMDFE
jgi:hypothetical protein